MIELHIRPIINQKSIKMILLFNVISFIIDNVSSKLFILNDNDLISNDNHMGIKIILLDIQYSLHN